MSAVSGDAAPAATTPVATAATAAPEYPPVMVACTVGEVTALWQVETDPAVLRGDFSGAWVLGAAGVEGFAAEAEWIAERHDPVAMRGLLNYYPVCFAPGSAELGGGGGRDEAEGMNTAEGNMPNGGTGSAAKWGWRRVMDSAATVEAAQAAVEEARSEFARRFPEKKQPAWGSIAAPPEHDGQAERAGQPESAERTGQAESTEQSNPTECSEQTEQGEGAKQPGQAGKREEGRDDTPSDREAAIQGALRMARHLRSLARQWVAFEKVRVRRLGDPEHIRPLPVVAESL